MPKTFPPRVERVVVGHDEEGKFRVVKPGGRVLWLKAVTIARRWPTLVADPGDVVAHPKER